MARVSVSLRRNSTSISERVCYFENMECVSGDRLASALAMRRRELWDSNPRLAERIEMRIRTHNAPTDKRTALHWMPRAVWPSSTLISPPADETRVWAVPGCLGNRGIHLLF